jgi:Spy/CpxP family protein refolding chaperone
MNINKGLTIIVALAMIFTVASQATAGRGGWNNCDGDKAFRGGHRGRHGGHGMMGLGFLRAADLTDDQKKQVAGILNGYLEEMKTRTEAMKTARKTMVDVMTADGATETAVLEAYRNVASAGEALAVLRFNVTADVKKVLTDDQIATLKEKKALRAERMQKKHERRWAEFEKRIDELTQ